MITLPEPLPNNYGEKGRKILDELRGRIAKAAGVHSAECDRIILEWARRHMHQGNVHSVLNGQFLKLSRDSAETIEASIEMASAELRRSIPVSWETEVDELHDTLTVNVEVTILK